MYVTIISPAAQTGRGGGWVKENKVLEMAQSASSPVTSSMTRGAMSASVRGGKRCDMANNFRRAKTSSQEWNREVFSSSASWLLDTARDAGDPFGRPAHASKKKKKKRGGGGAQAARVQEWTFF